MQDCRVKTFLTVCRTLNYTRAAEELALTQPAVSQHITYLEREYGAKLFTYHRKKLELTLIDDEDRPAYQIAQIAEYLMKDLNFFCLLTERAEAFEELAEEAMEEYGLLLVLLPKGNGKVPGNLILDVGEWEKHLDIISAVRYNTLTI